MALVRRGHGMRSQMKQPEPLSKRHRYSVYAVVAALIVSGAAWLVCRYVLNADAAFPDDPHPLQPFWLKVHGAAAMISLIVVGSLFPWHAWRAWKAGRNRASGLIMGVVFLILVGTAWALYYVGTETLRPWLSVIHWGLGLLLVPALLAHVVIGRRATASKSITRHASALRTHS